MKKILSFIDIIYRACLPGMHWVPFAGPGQCGIFDNRAGGGPGSRFWLRRYFERGVEDKGVG